MNPSIGVTYSPARAVTLYANYAESSRSPTSIELGCADPQNPCVLPNALAGDPPLKQVITRTFEVGARGHHLESRIDWSTGWFRAINYNDLLFVTSDVTGNGYFKNFGRTLRQGIEAHLSTNINRNTLGGNYTFLRATYGTSEIVNGSSNSTNDLASSGLPGIDGVIQIQPGDRIPLLPQHLLKTFADAQITRRLSVDIDLIAVSSSFAHGNENNQSQSDELYYRGPGTSPGYSTMNLGTRYQVQKHVRVFVQVNNVLNHRYYTAASLGPTGYTDQGTFIARPFPAVNGNLPVVHATFLAPGPPFGVWGGTRFTF